MKSLSRLDTSPIARWWWSVDHTALSLIAFLVAIGLVLVLAASPSAAMQKGIGNEFHFAIRQALFLGPAAVVMVGVSMMTPLAARRLGTVLFAVAFLLVVLSVLFAPEINGAKRWFSIGPLSLQPSEFLKPGFVIVAAWMLSESSRNPAFPGLWIAMSLYLICVLLLIMQPDYGQAALLSAVWAVMFFISGFNLAWIIVLGSVGAGALVFGYFFSPHFARRIDTFLDPASGDTYQVDKSLEAIARGGAFGRAGESGAIKTSLPDPHTDFIFAVAGEEYGAVLCLIVVVLFAALVARVFTRASAMKSVFAQSAACGLGAMIGVQAVVNMGVSLRALPAKGMTLPFISYGGSSLLAIGLSAGLILALTRVHGQPYRRRELMT